jgi:hypothetical protein
MVNGAAPAANVSVVAVTPVRSLFVEVWLLPANTKPPEKLLFTAEDQLALVLQFPSAPPPSHVVCAWAAGIATHAKTISVTSDRPLARPTRARLEAVRKAAQVFMWRSYFFGKASRFVPVRLRLSELDSGHVTTVPPNP